MMKAWYVYVDDSRKCLVSNSDYCTTVTCRTYDSAIKTVEYLSATGQTYVLDLNYNAVGNVDSFGIMDFIKESKTTEYCKNVKFH